MARSSRTLSRLVLGGLVIGILVDLVSMVHELSGHTLLERILAGTVDQSELIAWDSTFGSIGLAQAGIFVLTAAMWLAWQYRLVSSVEPLTGDEPLKSPGRSVLWWFVPLANLVVVPRIYNDLKSRLTPGADSIVGWWWGTYLVANGVTNLAGRVWSSGDSAADFTSGLNLWLASDALSIVAALVAMMLVRRLQGGQDASLAGPPPAVAINTLTSASAPLETR